MNLSKRLQTIAGFVPRCRSAADIGTDHGHLPVWLAEHDRAEHIIAMDVGEGPLSRARETISRCGMEDRIEVRLSDGFAELKPGEAEVVVIAGMGGLLIQKILLEGQHMWDSVSHYILSPQSEIGDTRRFLADHGFKILREDMLEDMGKYYLVWDVVRGSMDPQENYEYEYGKLLIEAAHPVLRVWLEQQISQTWMLEEKLREAGTDKSRERIRELEEERAMMSRALNALNKASGQADGGFC